MTIPQDIDKVFKEGLKDFSESPPSFVWSNVEQTLNQNRLKRRRNIMYSIAATVALLIAFGAGYMATNIGTNDMVASNSLEPQTLTEFDNENGSEVKKESSNKSDIKLVSPIVNETTVEPKLENSIDENEDVKENKPEQIQPEGEKKSKVKKVNSSGTLLPPMFAAGTQYNNSSSNEECTAPVFHENNMDEIIEEENDEQFSFNSMELKQMSLPNVENKNQLAYDERQLANPYDFALANPEKADYKSWSVGVSAAPLVSYRDVVSTSSDMLYEADLNSNYDQNYANEKPLTSYSAGVNVNYNVSKRLKVQSGLYYSEMGQVIQNVPIYPQPAYANPNMGSYSVNTSIGNIAVSGNQNQLIDEFSEQDAVESVRNPKGSAPTYLMQNEAVSSVEADFVQTYEFYEIPVVLNYTVIDRKLAMNVSGGVSANVMYSNSTYVEDEGTRYQLDAVAEDLKDMNYSGVLGLGLEYPLIERLKINLQPTFRYSLSAINNAGSVYPYSFGIYTGLRYSF